MPAKQSESNLTGLLEIPLITSRTGPMKRLVTDLHDAARQLDQARNAIVDEWLYWRRRLHPDWKPPVVLDANGNPKLNKKGEPYLVSPMHPVRVDRQGNPVNSDTEDSIGFSTYLYHAGRKAAPNVAANLISMAVKEVMSNLQTDVQHHGGLHKFRWQAILAKDEQMPTFRARTIPVPNNSAIFVYAGKATAGKGVSKEDRKLAEFWGKSSAVIAFPIFSGTSGRDVTTPIATINVGALSPGNREVLAKVARGEWKWSDSKLVFKKERWQIQFTYRQPEQGLGLDKERDAFLFPQFPEAQRPFFIECAESGKSWRCGNGLWLAAEFNRLDVRRKRIRGRYKVASSGVKGHGRKRFEMRLKPWSRSTQDCQRHFTWQLIAEIVRFCKANNCGTVVYREPSLGIREHLWLGKKGVPYDWTGLATNLAYKLKQFGIECSIDRINGKDLRERFSDGKPKGPKPTEPTNGNGHAPIPKKDASRVPQSDGDAGNADGPGSGSRFLGKKNGKPLANGDARPAVTNGSSGKSGHRQR